MIAQRELKLNFDIRRCAEFEDATHSYAVGVSFPVDRESFFYNASMADFEADKETDGKPKEEFWSLYKLKSEDTTDWEAVSDHDTEEQAIAAADKMEGFNS